MSNDLWVKLMEFGKIAGCHQKPERSFFIKGWQFPVCARCTGILIGHIAAVMAAIFKVKFNIYVCLGMLLIMVLDGTIQYLKIKESTNLRRFVTGVTGGIGFAGGCIWVLKKVLLFLYSVL